MRRGLPRGRAAVGGAERAEGSGPAMFCLGKTAGRAGAGLSCALRDPVPPQRERGRGLAVGAVPPQLGGKAHGRVVSSYEKNPAETGGEYSEEVSWAGGDPQVLPSQQVPFVPF